MNTIIDKIDLWTTAQELKTSNRGLSASNQSLIGIKKLRELILELAIRGKLVSQDPNDEPASELLKKIEAEKRRFIKEWKIKKQETSPEVGEDEKPFNLPKGWEWVRLQQIIQISSGDGLIAANMNSDGTVPVFGGNGINGYHDKANVYKSTLVIGRVGFYCGSIHITPQSAWVTDNAFITTFSEENIYINFLYWLLKGTNLKENENATAQPVISGRKVYPIVVGLPPLAEQNRIVAKVDELMALCDELENQQTSSNVAHETLVATLLGSLTDAENSNSFDESWQRIANHFDILFTTEHSIDQLKQTILQLAVMGKLVPQNHEDEPASELLKKIAKEKVRLVKEGKIKKQALLPEITEDEKAFDLPNSWAWVAWGNLLAYDDGAFKRGPFGSSLKKDMFVDSGYKVYEQYCPINDDCSFERYYITNELYENLKTFAVKANDYLISCSGATLGRITQVPEDFKEGIINQALLRVRINHEYLDGAFFKLLFRSPFFQKMILDNSTGSAIPNVKGVNELKSMPIPFLPLAEQYRIVSKVDELFALCDALKERLVEAQTLQNQMAVAVVEQALN